MDKDIQYFVNAISAKEPQPGDRSYLVFRQLFKRANYFLYKGNFLIVKISRSNRPFWNVGKDFIDLLNDLDNYFVVLLSSPRAGWFFSKREVNNKIAYDDWRLHKESKQYKINPPSLRDENRFNSPEDFIERIDRQIIKNP